MSLTNFHKESATDVLVTGIGMVTPLAIGREPGWQRLLAGKTAGRTLHEHEIDCFDQLAEMLGRSPGGAPVDHQLVKELASRISFDQHHRVFNDFGQDELNNLVLVSIDEALRDAELETIALNPHRVGCIVGTSKASLRSLEKATAEIDRGRFSDSQHWRNNCQPDSPARAVAALTGAKATVSCPIAACATGLVSINEAADLIRRGQCDVCFAGSVDASLRASVVGSFHRLGVTSRSSNPATAGKPFDQYRDGFIIGEGAAIFVLESRKHAEHRRARSYARIVSGALLTDPTGITQIDTSGRIVANVIKSVCCLQERSQMIPDICSLHGTGTESNDLAETNGMSLALGDHRVPSYGIKGAIGHLLGAAASVELATLILSLRDSVVPATVNLNQQDSRCRTTLSNAQQRGNFHSALKLSLGFGGHIAGCIVDRPGESRSTAE